MSNLDNMRKRVGYFGVVKRVDKDGNEVSGKGKYKRITQIHDQWTRMREDKLRSLRKALYYSYQAAVVQKYNVEVEGTSRLLINLATQLEKIATLTTEEKASLMQKLSQIEITYPELSVLSRYSQEYLSKLHEIIDENSSTEPYFRCLINHDKLKVDYEDKIISIPFEENSVTIDPVLDNDDLLETNFHNGTVFKWVHGNKEEWTPDTYWIVYLQYSEETAYFRAEIRKADEEIEIIFVDEDGNEQTQVYRGWMTGPNEETVVWNVKKGVVWNDLNYTKKLYITKDENTLAFFNRFDRVIINGHPWEVQAYNDNYGSSSKDVNTGIIRVALKETYTNTDEQIKAMKQEESEKASNQVQEIVGADVLAPYDVVTYEVLGEPDGEWGVAATQDSDKQIEDLVSWKILDGNKLQISVVTEKSFKKGFNIQYGNLNKHITIKSL